MNILKTAKPLFLFFCLSMVPAFVSQPAERDGKQHMPYTYFENPQVCAGCHWDRFSRWYVSQHSKGFTGDFFQKQFYDLVLPSRSFDSRIADVHEGCIGCHSPSAFLAGEMAPKPTANPDNHWKRGSGNKTTAERGIFCDFCHTLEGFKNSPPFNHDYISAATAEIDPKRADLEFPWSPFHTTKRTEIFESPDVCATCHNELNPYGVWVKATEKEYQESEYPGRGILCQTCHMQPMGGKPAKMGPPREQNHDHWFGGGFHEFVEGAAKVTIDVGAGAAKPGQTITFDVLVHNTAAGHKFPTGSVEERDVWLHVTAHDERGEEIDHIKISPNRNDPHDPYFITSNDKVAYPSHSRISSPFMRDSLPEGDRIYHSAFLDSEGKFTYAQWMATEEIENRIKPDEERVERFNWRVPENIAGGKVYIHAVLNYRRMPDSFADYLKIERRPVVEVSRDEAALPVAR
jgi:hypothetical protein